MFSLVRWLLSAAFDGSAVPLGGAKAASIITVIIWNFALLRLWVFRAAPAEGGADA